VLTPGEVEFVPMLKEASDNKKLQCSDTEKSLGGIFLLLCPVPSTPAESVGERGQKNAHFGNLVFTGC